MHTNTAISRQPVGGAGSYFLRSGYRSRDHVECFLDETDDTVTWQPDVDPYTTARAKELDRDVVIDVGCGRAGKLASPAGEYPAWFHIGVDFGDNFVWCRDDHLFGEWIEIDLESAERLPIAPSLVRRSIVVCSDMIEHLVNLMPALSLIRGLLMEGSAAAVLSTIRIPGMLIATLRARDSIAPWHRSLSNAVAGRPLVRLAKDHRKQAQS